MLEVIDADQLPVRFGGTRTGAAGDDGCADQITYVDKLNNEVGKINDETLESERSQRGRITE